MFLPMLVLHKCRPTLQPRDNNDDVIYADQDADSKQIGILNWSKDGSIQDRCEERTLRGLTFVSVDPLSFEVRILRGFPL